MSDWRTTHVAWRLTQIRGRNVASTRILHLGDSELRLRRASHVRTTRRRRYVRIACGRDVTTCAIGRQSLEVFLLDLAASNKGGDDIVLRRRPSEVNSVVLGELPKLCDFRFVCKLFLCCHYYLPSGLLLGPDLASLGLEDTTADYVRDVGPSHE